MSAPPAHDSWNPLPVSPLSYPVASSRTPCKSRDICGGETKKSTFERIEKWHNYVAEEKSQRFPIFCTVKSNFVLIDGNESKRNLWNHNWVPTFQPPQESTRISGYSQPRYRSSPILWVHDGDLWYQPANDYKKMIVMRHVSRDKVLNTVINGTCMSLFQREYIGWIQASSLLVNWECSLKMGYYIRGSCIY